MPADMNVVVDPKPLPKSPGAWLWSRGRIYLFVLGCVIAGFFFVAGWMATTPTENFGLNSIGVGQTVVAVAALVFAWLGVRWGGRQKGSGGVTDPRYR